MSAMVPIAVRRGIREAAQLCRVPAGRHRARAHVRAWGSLPGWRWRLRCLRRELGRGPIVGISLLQHVAEVVAAEPIVRHLRARHPEAVLVWVAGARTAPLVRHHPCLDAVLELGCLSEWIELRERVPFDRLYDLQLHGGYCPVCRVPLSRPAGERQVTLRDRWGREPLMHVLCSAAGLAKLNDRPRLHLPLKTSLEVDAMGLPGTGADYVVVHGRPGDPSDAAAWEPEAEGWLTLVEGLLASGRQVVEIGPRSVLDRRPRSRAGGAAAGRRKLPYRDLCGRLSLLQQAEVVRRAGLFIGIAGGPAHMAHAAGTPGIVLLGRSAGRRDDQAGRLAAGAARVAPAVALPAVATVSLDCVLEAIAGSTLRCASLSAAAV